MFTVVHPVDDNLAVTVKVEVIGVVPEFVAVKTGTLPLPLVAARPILPLVRVHEIVAPLVVLENVKPLTTWPGQKV